MKCGDIVEWCSQANGSKKVKRGTIVVVIPPRVSLSRAFHAENFSFADGRYDYSAMEVRDYNERKLESFIVVVEPSKGSKRRPKLYWPRLASLRVLGKQEVA